MRITTYLEGSDTRVAAEDGDLLVDVARARAVLLELNDGHDPRRARAIGLAAWPQDVGVLFGIGEGAWAEGARVLDAVRAASDDVRAELVARRALLDPASVRFVPPLGDDVRVLCIGLNYGAHVAEGGRATDPEPLFHLRSRATFAGHREALVRPKVSEQLDWEIELGVVIGRPGRYVAESDAMSHVAGLTIVNEGSLRDYQFRGRTSMPGKNFDRSGSIGPSITIGDRPDIDALELTTEVNGEVVQQARAAEMIYSVPRMLASLSEYVTLQPGDVIATGTPEGVGFRRTPPRFLVPGDQVRFTVTDVGTLENGVVDEVVR